ncbi:hypothetical protein K2173_007883 [Erythroxylum novogranatense]|uniref:Protein CutA, chloroplastic n=1 Tax=Erythroxylum novogranatense TaxID=1862640 RepID=A0AAV8T7Z7_9ROSI|nr:hypothetical protein K2173_007883 [Erythroxylum novogranatense]
MALALRLCSRPSLASLSSSTIRRRVPLIGAFCLLSVGLSSLSSSSHTTGSSLSLRLFKKRQYNTQAGAEAVRMEGNTVPSIVVYVTVPNREAGKKLADSIIKEKLAACVNIVPGILSVYQWQGEVQTDSEELLIIKTRQSLLEALTEHVKANHEYDVPEVISLPITGGSIPYLEWLKSSTRD